MKNLPPGPGVPWNVGDSFTGTVVVTNQSTAPNNTNLINIDALYFTPSCGATSGGGVCDTVPVSFADPGVFSVTNPVGAQKCAGSAWSVANVDPVTGEFQLVPNPPVQLGSTDLLQGQVQCQVTFTVTVLKVPTIDAFGTAGVQTIGLARGDFTDATTQDGGSGDGATSATITGPTLTVTKTATPPTVNAGQNAVFTITIDNTAGTGAAANVQLSDTLTNFGTTWSLSMNPAVAGCSLSVANPQVLTCDTLSIPAGATQVLTLTAPTNPQACPPALVNTASLNGANGFVFDPPVTSQATLACQQINTDLSITKTDNSATYTAGSAISYSIVVSNAGPLNATGASVADTVPAAITGVTVGCVATGTANCGTNGSAGNNVSFTGVNINAGAGNFITITVSGTVNPATVGNLENTATVAAGAGQVDPNPENNSATDVDTPAPLTDLAIFKTDNSLTYTAGAPISYTIVVVNAGPSNATGAAVADTVPAAITGVTVNCVPTGAATCGTNGSAGNNVSFTGVNLAAGVANFLTITVSGTVNPATTGDLSNTATVTPGTSQSDPTPGNNTATDIDTPAPLTDLVIFKTDNSLTYTAGAPISYTIAVVNVGPSNATGVSVADVVPAAITGVTVNCVPTGAASCGTNGSAGNNVSFTGVNLAAGVANSLTITVSGTVNPAATGDLVNTATVTVGSGQTDPEPGNNSATDTDTPAGVTNLGITKTDGSTTYTAGAGISYTIVVTNLGPSNAIGASVADVVPAAITGVTANCVSTGTANCGTNASAGNNVSFTGVNINAGAGNFLTITVSGTVNPAATGDLVNTATVTPGSGQTDPTPGDNTATDTDTPSPLTDLVIFKTDNSLTYTAGTAISYTIAVVNVGPSNATGVSVADVVPAAITGVTVNCVPTGAATCGTNGSAGNNVSFTGANIAAGVANSLTITVSGTVNPAATGDLVNTATVTVGSGQTDPEPGNNSATDTDTPAPTSNLTASKSDGISQYTPNTTTTYTIVIGNNGPSDAIGAVVSDPKPSQITSWTWVCSGATGGATGCDGAASNSANFTDTVNLPVGSTITYTVTAQIGAGATGNLVNTVTVTPPSGGTPGTSTDTNTPPPPPVIPVTQIPTLGEYALIALMLLLAAAGGLSARRVGRKG